MRLKTYAASLLFLTACTPAPPAPAPGPAAARPTEAPSAANGDALALRRTPAAGEWSAHADEGVLAANFGAPPGDVFSIVCRAPTGAIVLTLKRDLAPQSAAALRIITTTRTLELPGRERRTAAGEGRAFAVDIADNTPEHSALISMLGAPGDRFALEAGGVITVLPWDDAIARTLIGCR